MCRRAPARLTLTLQPSKLCLRWRLQQQPRDTAQAGVREKAQRAIYLPTAAEPCGNFVPRTADTHTHTHLDGLPKQETRSVVCWCPCMPAGLQAGSNYVFYPAKGCSYEVTRRNEALATNGLRKEPQRKRASAPPQIRWSEREQENTID